MIQASGRTSPFGWLRARGVGNVILMAGLVFSVSICSILYLLAMTVHPPPPFGAPGASTSLAAWADAHANWGQTSRSYSLDFGLSLLGPPGFAVGLGVLNFPRAAFVVSFSLLNIFFAWTDWAFASIWKPLADGLTTAISAQDYFILSKLNLLPFFGTTLVVADAEALTMLCVVITSVFLMTRKRGKTRAATLSLWAASLSLMVFGIEIAAFDHRELYLHVTQAQVVLNIAPWFSNADLFLSALAVFGLTSMLLRRS